MQQQLVKVPLKTGSDVWEVAQDQVGGVEVDFASVQTKLETSRTAWRAGRIELTASGEDGGSDGAGEEGKRRQQHVRGLACKPVTAGVHRHLHRGRRR